MTDIWEWCEKKKPNAIVIPTNGSVRKDGAAVMGRGLALQTRKRYGEGIAFLLGERIRRFGNYPFVLVEGAFPDGLSVVSFPVKHQWPQQADLDLIYESWTRLLMIIDRMEWTKVVMPRVGCGNGGLKWEDVSALLKGDFLNTGRIIIVDRAGSG